ncbi:hypothetical protein ACFCWG_02225, partial [Streptomyces sp. NPDC056390]
SEEAVIHKLTTEIRRRTLAAWRLERRGHALDFGRPVPLGNTILAPVCSFSARGSGLRGAWDDPSMPLSIVTALVRNLIKVPAAVLGSRVAKDAEVLALPHENAVLRMWDSDIHRCRPKGTCLCT